MHALERTDFQAAERANRLDALSAARAAKAQADTDLQDACRLYEQDAKRTPGSSGEYGSLLVMLDIDQLKTAGLSIANAAREVASNLAQSRFTSCKVPDLSDLVARMVEAIDDSVPVTAWAVIAASAKSEVL